MSVFRSDHAVGSSFSGSVTIPWTNGSPAANTLLLAVAMANFNVPITPPTGWTTIYTDTSSFTFGLYAKLATGSEPSSVTWGGGSYNIGAAMAVFTNAARAIPKYSLNVGTSLVSTQAATLTPAAVNALELLLGCLRLSGSTGATATPPTGYSTAATTTIDSAQDIVAIYSNATLAPDTITPLLPTLSYAGGSAATSARAAVFQIALVPYNPAYTTNTTLNVTYPSMITSVQRTGGVTLPVAAANKHGIVLTYNKTLTITIKGGQSHFLNGFIILPVTASGTNLNTLIGSALVSPMPIGTQSVNGYLNVGRLSVRLRTGKTRLPTLAGAVPVAPACVGLSMPRLVGNVLVAPAGLRVARPATLQGQATVALSASAGSIISRQKRLPLNLGKYSSRSVVELGQGRTLSIAASGTFQISHMNKGVLNVPVGYGHYIKLGRSGALTLGVSGSGARRVFKIEGVALTVALSTTRAVRDSYMLRVAPVSVAKSSVLRGNDKFLGYTISKMRTVTSAGFDTMTVILRPTLTVRRGHDMPFAPTFYSARGSVRPGGIALSIGKTGVGLPVRVGLAIALPRGAVSAPRSVLRGGRTLLPYTYLPARSVVRTEGATVAPAFIGRRAAVLRGAVLPTLSFAGFKHPVGGVMLVLSDSWNRSVSRNGRVLIVTATSYSAPGLMESSAAHFITPLITHIAPFAVLET